MLVILLLTATVTASPSAAAATMRSLHLADIVPMLRTCGNMGGRGQHKTELTWDG